MRHLTSALIAVWSLSALTAAQPQLQGYVFGNYGPGNYLVVDDITLAEDQSMVMLPGTNFLFAGNHRFSVHGNLRAVGNATDSIKFVPDGAAHRWAGIHFRESEQSVLAYCQISGSDSGGIDLFDSNPTISHCTISDNSTPWRGGGIWVGAGADNTIISNCTISGNFADWSGGGIGTQNGGFITDCLITQNSTNGSGGGLEVDQCNPTISHCTISDNEAYGGGDGGGGGIMIFKGCPIISHCLFTGNLANTYGGGLLLSDADILISNCTISRNSAAVGGGIYFEVYYSWITTIVNTIVEGNLGNYGVYFQWGPYAEITFSDFYNNQEGNFYNPPTGVETLVGVNANGDSCDVFYNIFEDPLFENPAQGNFQITWANYPIPDSTLSPCIDAGDPATPHDPDGTVADIGALYFDQGALVTVTLIPYNPPVTIPATGGSFDFNVSLENADPDPATFDAWIMVQLPDLSWFGPVLGPINLTLPGITTIDRDRTQNVPAGAPPGTYTYEGRVGNYPDEIWESDSFTFEKLEIGDGTSVTGWTNTGESFNLWFTETDTETPTDFQLFDAYPNPFNPMTTISYAIPEAANITLKVYDVSGCSVATLIDGWRETGYHEVTFDASHLPSGVYLARLHAGKFEQVKKLVLIK